MKRVSGTVKLSAAFLFSLWFLILPAYHYFVYLDSSDLNPSYPCLKSAFEEDSAACPKKKERLPDSSPAVRQTVLEQPAIVHIAADKHPQRLPSSPSVFLVLRC